MKYLIRANKVVFSGNMQMIMKYISDFYKSESKLWTDKNGNFADLGKFKTFIESMDYKILDKIPPSCRCEGTAISISDFKKIFGEEHFFNKSNRSKITYNRKNGSTISKKIKIKEIICTK